MNTRIITAAVSGSALLAVLLTGCTSSTTTAPSDDAVIACAAINDGVPCTSIDPLTDTQRVELTELGHVAYPRITAHASSITGDSDALEQVRRASQQDDGPTIAVPTTDGDTRYFLFASCGSSIVAECALIEVLPGLTSADTIS